MTKTVSVTPKAIAKKLLSIVSFLLAIHLCMVIAKCVFKHARLKGLVPAFYLDNEFNVPAFYSAMAILLCACILWIIGDSTHEKRNEQSRYWKLLSVLFIFLALDEFLVIHEYFILLTQDMMEISSQSNFLYFAWFIPYCGIFALIGLFLIKFFIRLPSRTRVLFAASGILFLSGAVGMEMVGGKYWSEQGWVYGGYVDVYDLGFALLITIEEVLEMLGIILFAYSLAAYHQMYIKQSHLKLWNINLDFGADATPHAHADVEWQSTGQPFTHDPLLLSASDSSGNHDLIYQQKASQ